MDAEEAALTRACVVNVHRIRNAPMPAGFVYVGRGRCPFTGRRGPWGNPFTVKEHGRAAMRLYLDWLRDDPKGRLRARLAREHLVGKVLGCWCAPKPCHGEVLARLANGEDLQVIRENVLARVGPEQTSLF